MLPARTPLARAVAGATFAIVLLAACTTPVPPSPPESARPVEPEPEPVASTSAPSPLIEPPPPSPAAPRSTRVLDPAAVPVVARLAKQLRISPEAITVAQVAQAEWPNACLGLAAEGEICAQMITPGYAVSLIVDEQRYEFRTDASGRRIRLAFAPLTETGDVLVTWRDSASFSLLVIGTERLAFGLRGGPRLVAPPLQPERAQEMLQFASRFAPFNGRTAAGEVAFRGTGQTPATPVEQRQIAEWARLVAAESETGLRGRSDDRAFVWRRIGGAAGFCDEVVVSRAGRATAWPCRFPDSQPTATITLSPPELEQIYRWLDTLAPFSWEDDSGAAEALTLHLELAGQGTKPLSEAERERMLEFSNALVRRLVVDGRGAGT